MPSILQRIRQKIRSGKYRFTWHMEFETMSHTNEISKVPSLWCNDAGDSRPQHASSRPIA